MTRCPLLHEEFLNNILAYATIRNGNYEEASREPGLIKVEGWYDTPTVQHCHIENHMCFASVEAGRIVIYSSTQIPHIVRRVVGQARHPWGKVRVVKPYIGGGFGNKQDALYEPLCAYLSTVGAAASSSSTARARRRSSATACATPSARTSSVGAAGRHVRPARKIECFSNQGAYASHGHGIVAKGMGAFPQLYPCPNVDGDAYTVHEPPRRGRDARLRHPAGHVRGRIAH